MVAVGRAAHLRFTINRKKTSTLKGSQNWSSTHFGVGRDGFLAIRGCAARPTATILDPFGIVNDAGKDKLAHPSWLSAATASRLSIFVLNEYLRSRSLTNAWRLIVSALITPAKLLEAISPAKSW